MVLNRAESIHFLPNKETPREFLGRGIPWETSRNRGQEEVHETRK